jgi:catechol 2,3-dioxygenase-like lactoylglutathione lyase family enzyme
MKGARARKVRAIDFVQIGVADMDRAVRFYRDTLGMDFPLSGGDNTDWNWKEFDTPPVALALDRDGPAPGLVSLALAVDDVAAAVEELRAKGVPIVVEPREQDVCYAAVIRAPDGNEIVLHRRKDGTAG